MLRRIGAEEAGIRIADAEFPSPFASGAEYSCSARGTWNIVHTGMLIPQAHQVFVCAAGCLRGVVLTAAEMHAEERFSTVEIHENNLLDGDMEELIIEGVSDVIVSLPIKPPAVLVYTSCIHHFTGCDLGMVYAELRKRFPDIEFTDCYMNPIMRKSGLNPDQLMRRQLYSLLEACPSDGKAVNILGNDLPTYESSELVRLIRESGYTLRDITLCGSYEEYKRMASAAVNITYYPAAKAGGEALSERLGRTHLYLPLSYDYSEITDNLNVLADCLSVPRRDYSENIRRCEDALDSLAILMGSTPVSVDYTLTPRPLGLARLLLMHGINVTEVYLDSVSGEEKNDFDRLAHEHPDIMLMPTVSPRMRTLSRQRDGKVVALGQKAAYFTSTPYFVNIVEGGGLYGFDGIERLCALIAEAYNTPKDTMALIQIKGWGCGCV